MSNLQPITIIGGGPAGLALGLALRTEKVPVTVCEAGHYPRHKVCGEFISGKGLDLLKTWDFLPRFHAAGARAVRTVRFVSGNHSLPVLRLPRPALALSRFSMDHVMAQAFCREGGTLIERTRWHGDFAGQGIVRAAGRKLSAPSQGQGWRWFGLKAHARGVRMVADLEMHLRPDGYVGLCQLDADTVNVCGLFRSSRPVPELSRVWQSFLRGDPSKRLARRLEKAQFDSESFVSVAGLSFSAVVPNAGVECCVGDAWGMIPPLTGNGLSMAFESALLAFKPLLSYSRGECNWQQTQQVISNRHWTEFSPRYKWGRIAQQLLWRPASRAALLLFGLVCWPLVFARTR